MGWDGGWIGVGMGGEGKAMKTRSRIARRVRGFDDDNIGM